MSERKLALHFSLPLALQSASPAPQLGLLPLLPPVQ